MRVSRESRRMSRPMDVREGECEMRAADGDVSRRRRRGARIERPDWRRPCYYGRRTRDMCLSKEIKTTSFRSLPQSSCRFSCHDYVTTATKSLVEGIDVAAGGVKKIQESRFAPQVGWSYSKCSCDRCNASVRPSCAD